MKENYEITEVEKLKKDIIKAENAFQADDFTLYRGAKPNKDHKICRIGNKTKSGLGLHHRLSLVERLISVQLEDSNKPKLKNVDTDTGHVTYVVANFGLVFTNKKHEKNGDHKRIFKTMPVSIKTKSKKSEIEYAAILSNKTDPNHSYHAEETLYDYLSKDENITRLIRAFKKDFGLKDGAKIYAVILDLHGTYDMCVSCHKIGLEFKDKFRKKFFKLLKNKSLKSLTKEPKERLPICTRYSSSKLYISWDTVENRQNPRKQGILYTIQKHDSNHKEDKRRLEETDQFSSWLDIRQLSKNLLIHGSSKWHKYWDEQNKEKCYGKEIKPGFYTVFTSLLMSTIKDKEIDYTTSKDLINTKRPKKMKKDLNEVSDKPGNSKKKGKGQ